MTIGAATTYAELRNNETPGRAISRYSARQHPKRGAIATQNRGTIGGNIANASPAADSPPALLVYDAEIELVSARGARWRP